MPLKINVQFHNINALIISPPSMCQYMYLLDVKLFFFKNKYQEVEKSIHDTITHTNLFIVLYEYQIIITN